MFATKLYHVEKAGKAIFLVLLFMPVFSFCQRSGGAIDNLRSGNGFGGITLGGNINQLPMEKLGFLDGVRKYYADSCLLYEYKDAQKLKLKRDLYLDLIGFRTYKQKIINVYLFFKKEDGFKMLSYFSTAYGPFTEKPDDNADIYNWHSSGVNLSLRYELNVDLGVAIFSTNTMYTDIALASIVKQ